MRRFCNYSLSGGVRLRLGVSLTLISLLHLPGCQALDDAPTDSSRFLDLSFGVRHAASRSVITDNLLPSGSKVGVTLSGTDYADYSNVCYTASGTGASQSWAGSVDVLLTSSAATLYSYYPYSADVSSDAIPVETASQTDYMYGTPVTGISEAKASCGVTLNHALANIRLDISRGSYTGAGVVSRVLVSGAGIATGGTFNAATAAPGYTAYSGEGSPVERTVSASLGTPVDVMVVPTGTSSAVTFTVTVDGTDYTATSSAVALQMGSSYIFTLTLVTGRALTVSYVGVDAWVDIPEHDAIIMTDENQSVRLVGDIDNIAFSSSLSADGTVTILVVPVNPDFIKPLSVTATGSVSLVQTGCVLTGCLALTLSDLVSDVVLTFVENDVFDELGYSVDISGDIQGLTIDRGVLNDGSKAILISGIDSPSALTVSGSATVTKNFDPALGTWTVTLADIGSDIDIHVDVYTVNVTYNTDILLLTEHILTDSSVRFEFTLLDSSVDPSLLNFDVTGTAVVENTLVTSDNKIILLINGISSDLVIDASVIDAFVFIVGGISYTVFNGMTWAEFCDSELNPDSHGWGMKDFSYYNGLVLYLTGAGMQMDLMLDGVRVKSTDLIKPDVTYDIAAGLDTEPA